MRDHNGVVTYIEAENSTNDKESGVTIPKPSTLLKGKTYTRRVKTGIIFVNNTFSIHICRTKTIYSLGDLPTMVYISSQIPTQLGIAVVMVIEEIDISAGKDDPLILQLFSSPFPCFPSFLFFDPLKFLVLVCLLFATQLQLQLGGHYDSFAAMLRLLHSLTNE